VRRQSITLNILRTRLGKEPSLGKFRSERPASFRLDSCLFENKRCIKIIVKQPFQKLIMVTNLCFRQKLNFQFYSTILNNSIYKVANMVKVKQCYELMVQKTFNQGRITRFGFAKDLREIKLQEKLKYNK
jgi:hypothetical protein